MRRTHHDAHRGRGVLPSFAALLSILVPACGGTAATGPDQTPVDARADHEAPAVVDPKQPPPAIVGPSPAEPAKPAVIAAAACDAPNVETRREGGLVVHPEPPPSERAFAPRMRTHTDGALSAGSERVWVGPVVPAFVPLTVGTAELFLLDRAGDDFVALYRDPYGASSCTLGDATNCDYHLTRFAQCGDLVWSIDLNRSFSRPDQLEIGDVRIADGVVYFNEACQSYARDAGNRCSSLVALDPVKNEVLWRSKPLTSRGELLVHGDYVVAGYGFTAEADRLSVVRRSDGSVVFTRPAATAPTTIAKIDEQTIVVSFYGGEESVFTLHQWDTANPSLVPR